MITHTRRFVRTGNSLLVLAGFLGGLLTSTAAFSQTNGVEPRPTITREDIRRAILPIDIDRPIAASPQGDNDWRSVARVKGDVEVRVILDDWRRYRGRFRAADDRSVTLEIDGVNRTFQRAQVRQVDARGGGRSGNAKAWAAVGMLVGSAAGLASCRGEEAECVQRRLFTSMTLGMGAGAIFGATRPSWSPIYAVR